MASNAHLVDELESSFQTCLSALTKQEHIGPNDQDETKASVEQSMQKYLDAAKQLETFFLQKRMLLAIHKPEQVMIEDMSELKLELQRKDVLIQKHYDKLQHWQNMLSRSGTPQTSTVTPPGQGVAPPQQPQPPVPQMPPQPQPHPQQLHLHPQTPPASQAMPPPQPSHPQYLQGPLAYLEQTTSSIGMPDGRR